MNFITGLLLGIIVGVGGLIIVALAFKDKM